MQRPSDFGDTSRLCEPISAQHNFTAALNRRRCGVIFLPDDRFAAFFRRFAMCDSSYSDPFSDRGEIGVVISPAGTCP
jgi:hypothetical protein